MLNITIPRNLNTHTVTDFLSQVITPDLTPVATEIEFDMTKIGFIEPGGVVALTNLINWLNKHQVSSTFFINQTKQNIGTDNYKSMLYLADCHFFKKQFKNDFFKTPKIRNTTLPISDISVQQFYSWCENELIPFLKKSTQKWDAEFSNIRIATEEIFNNIKDHSTEEIGCVFAQFYPRKHEIKIAFSDFGIGIPSSLSKIYPNKKHSELLKLSIKEGTSTKSTPRNRGAGLGNIVNSITANDIGNVQLISNRAKMDTRGADITYTEMSSFYPGTFFNLTIDVSNKNLYYVEEEEEFEW